MTRPVPVNISNFKNRKVGMALTAAAGPAANFITAFLAFAGYLAIGVYLLGTQVFSFGVGGVYLLMSLLTSGQIAANGIAVFLLVLMIFFGLYGGFVRGSRGIQPYPCSSAGRVARG